MPGFSGHRSLFRNIRRSSPEKGCAFDYRWRLPAARPFVVKSGQRKVPKEKSLALINFDIQTRDERIPVKRGVRDVIEIDVGARLVEKAKVLQPRGDFSPGEDLSRLYGYSAP